MRDLVELIGKLITTNVAPWYTPSCEQWHCYCGAAIESPRAPDGEHERGCLYIAAFEAAGIETRFVGPRQRRGSNFRKVLGLAELDAITHCGACSTELFTVFPEHKECFGCGTEYVTEQAKDADDRRARQRYEQDWLASHAGPLPIPVPDPDRRGRGRRHPARASGLRPRRNMQGALHVG